MSRVLPHFDLTFRKNAYRVRLRLDYPTGGGVFAVIDSNWPGMESVIVNTGGPNACLSYLFDRMLELRRSPGNGGPGFEVGE